MKFRSFRLTVAPVAALCLALAGCRMADAPAERDDLDSACRAAVELRLAPRTFELLANAADRVVGYERQVMRLKSAEKEDFRRFGAADDPRFVWAHEAECCVRLMLFTAASPQSDPEPGMKRVARKLLEFEQAVAWARLGECADAPRGNAELEAALLTLRISTGWPEERILAFDLTSLPEPGKAPEFAFPERSTAECAVDTLRATEALLALAAKSPMPGPEEIGAALDKVRAARLALAESYLRTALRRLASDRSPAALAAWRIAMARYELERSFPGL